MLNPNLPNLLAAIAVAIFLFAICLWIGHYVSDRRHRLRQAYLAIGKARRQSSDYPADYFIHDADRQELLRCFLRGYLQVPDNILGFDSRSGLTLADLSRLATLWRALGYDANLCYGLIDESKRRLFAANSLSYATIWVEFRHDGELWVYWYDGDAATVDYRRDFYRRGAATIIHDVSFRDAGAYLFKT